MCNDIEIKKSAIKLYYTLKNNGIKGKQRINIIETTFSIHITSLYNWIKDPDINIENTINKDVNKDINKNIEQLIIDCIINSCHKFSSINKLKKFINFNFKKNLSYKCIAYYLKINNLKCFNNKISPEIEKFIISNIKLNKILTAKDNIELVKNKFNIIMSDTSIYNIYKKYNLTFKKIKINNNPYPLDVQKEHLTNVKNVIEEIGIDNIIYLDEFSVVLNSHPINGWEEKGKDCIINSDDAKIINERFSVIAAISNKKVIDFTVVKKGFKTESYLKFVNKLSSKNHDNRYSYFMDNASIHRSKKTKECYKKNNMHIIFNAPYHSECNPIENVFSILRNKINRSQNKTYEDIINILRDFRTEIKEETLNNICNSSMKKLNDFLKT